MMKKRDGMSLSDGKIFMEDIEKQQNLNARRTEKHYQNVNTFNKYVGQDNILRVCARLGGFNWIYFRGDRFTKHPAFLEK